MQRHALLCMVASCSAVGMPAARDLNKVDAPLLATAANWGYRSMTVNFVCRCVAVPLSPHFEFQENIDLLRLLKNIRRINP